MSTSQRSVTRSGRIFKPGEMADERDGDASSEYTEHEREAATGATGIDALIQLMLQREEQMNRREEQMERERVEMKDRLERLMNVVEHSTRGGGQSAATVDADPTRTGSDPLKLSRLSEHDDIEAYLTTFERMMKAYEIKPERWAFKLATQLTGKAQQAYAALPSEEAGRK